MNQKTRGEDFDEAALKDRFHAPIPPNAPVPEHPKTPKKLVDRILREMEIPECGLLSWFDAEFTGKNLMEAVGDPLQMRGGFYPLSSGLDDSPFPDKVNTRMASEFFRVLAWVGRDVVEDREVPFTIVIAHELAHVEQYLYRPLIHYAGNLILAYLRRLPEAERAKYGYFDSPVEWDAESRARQIAVSIHGEQIVRDYMKSKEIRGFIEPQPVQSLVEVLEAVRKWFRDHVHEISDMTRTLRVPDPLLEHVRRVDWNKLGTPSP